MMYKYVLIFQCSLMNCAGFFVFLSKMFIAQYIASYFNAGGDFIFLEDICCAFMILEEATIFFGIHIGR